MENKQPTTTDPWEAALDAMTPDRAATLDDVELRVAHHEAVARSHSAEEMLAQETHRRATAPWQAAEDDVVRLEAGGDAYLAETNGDAWIEGGRVAGPLIYLPVPDGTVVVDHGPDGAWQATVRTPDGDVTPLDDGPTLDAPVPDVVLWLRTITDALPDED